MCMETGSDGLHHWALILDRIWNSPLPLSQSPCKSPHTVHSRNRKSCQRPVIYLLVCEITGLHTPFYYLALVAV
jgi:hypothetical protein